MTWQTGGPLWRHHLMQEIGAVVPHAEIWAGSALNPAFLPRLWIPKELFIYVHFIFRKFCAAVYFNRGRPLRQRLECRFTNFL